MESESEEFIILYSEPILDQYQNIYLNVLTLSGIPKGPLSNMTKRIKVPNLSPFQSFSLSNNPFPNCIYALRRYPNQWMYEDDIPYIFSYLQNNNYKIETILNNININNSQKNRKQICIFSYNPIQK